MGISPINIQKTWIPYPASSSLSLIVELGLVYKDCGFLDIATKK